MTSRNAAAVVKRRVFLKSTNDDWLSKLPNYVILIGVFASAFCFLVILSLMIVMAQTDYNAAANANTMLVTNPQWKVGVANLRCVRCS
jgi:hypothetical protein